MLERIASPDEPPLDLGQLTSKRDEVEYTQPDEREEVLASLNDMEKVFMRGRGNLEQWTPEVLDAIDKCFRTLFMSGGEPIAQLFFPYDDQGIALFNEYCEAVDAVLLANADRIPPYAREYFTYFTIWEKRDYAFPVPLGTASVIECLHKMACRVRKGMIEVSISVCRICVHHLDDLNECHPAHNDSPVCGRGEVTAHRDPPVRGVRRSRAHGSSCARGEEIPRTWILLCAGVRRSRAHGSSCARG
jgi:hypothetical protein